MWTDSATFKTGYVIRLLKVRCFETKGESVQIASHSSILYQLKSIFLTIEWNTDRGPGTAGTARRVSS